MAKSAEEGVLVNVDSDAPKHLDTAVEFEAKIWKQGDIYIIRVSPELVKEYDLQGLDVVVTIAPKNKPGYRVL